MRKSGVEKREVTLFLKNEDLPTQHFCMFCAKGIFRSHHRVIMVAYGQGNSEDYVSAPFSIQCHGCGTIWNVQGLNK